MSSLAKEDIQFIENYLENSEILYADIRMEMTDHVASAIEAQIQSGDDRGFYHIFKDYMVTHKSRLLENNKKFIRNADMSIFVKLKKQLLKPLNIVLFLVSFLAIYKALEFTQVEQLRKFITMFPVLSIVPFCIIYVILLKRFNLSRFSGIERLGFVHMIIFQLYNLVIVFLGIHVKNSANDIIVSLSFALIFTIAIVMIQLTFIVVSQYRKEYRLVH